jgi:hypothetical protein
MAEAQKEQARQGRDIGPIPPIKDPKRRKKGLASLRAFCTTYLAPAFPLPFSDDHLKVIAKIERAVLHGGHFAEAMPRGSGKSTICEAAVLWAALKGVRRFVALIAAVADFGTAMVDSINSELENNDLLLEDFPEVVYPFRALEQSNNRASGQRCMGKLTWIRRTSGKLVFPTIDGSLSSGVIIVGTGIEGGKLRGLRHKLKDGTVIRPDLIIGDDLQTDESAWSISECVKREKAITGKILGMAGPGMIPACIVCGTVIRTGDVMDNLLDRQKHPEWQGERMKMIYSFPKRMDFWDEYARILREDLAVGGNGSKARTFYRKNRKAMDQGAKVAWKHRKAKEDVSAIEHAMKLFYRDRETFFAEYQNEPVMEESARRIMTADQIAAKQNGLQRGDVPETCSRLTAFIDVHLELLYWLVMAWEDDFTGYVVDYGTYPDQKRSYLMLREVRRTLASVARREEGEVGMEGSIYAGLKAITNQLAEREFIRDDGVSLRIERIGIDANWGQTTSLVKKFCRQSIHAALLLPSHGHYYGARHKPLSQYEKKRGERLERDYNWHIPKVQHRQVRHITWDTNWWKSFAHARLGVAIGDPGCVSLFKSNDHRMLADHLTAETPTHTEGHGRKLDEWEQKPGTDNHLFDCFVGCHVLASERGCKLEAISQASRRRLKPKKPRMTLSELQRARRAGR